MNTDPVVEKVKVRIRLRPREDLPAGEFLWATPVDAHDGGGSYELANCAFFPWLAAGDLVRAELDGDGDLQVVDVLEPSDGILTAVTYDAVGASTAREAGDAWREQGAIWSEGGHGILKTIWRPGIGWGSIERAVAPYVDSGALSWRGGADPEHRGRDHHTDVDFELDRTQHVDELTTTYWVGDDPYWREHGFDDPDFLARVQTIASLDEPVARALERGDHGPLFDALRWLEEH